MRRKKYLALLIAGTLLLGIFCIGCSKKEKEKKDSSSKIRRTETVVSDFCKFLKNGNLDRVEKLVDGSSAEVDKLHSYQLSDVASILEHVGEYMTYEVQNVEVDSKEETGEAEVTFTTIQSEEVIARLSNAKSGKEIRNIVKEAEFEEITISLQLVKTESSWAITNQSADEAIAKIYAFIEKLDIDTTPKITPTEESAVLEFDVNYEYWLNDYFNQVEGYRQRATYVILFISTNKEFYDQIFYYEFTTPEGEKLYDGQYKATNGNNSIQCSWNSASLYGLSALCCNIYDDDNHLVHNAWVHIYGEDEEAPTEIDCIYIRLVNENGDVVPGFYEGDTYVGINVQLAYMFEDGPTSIYYELDKVATEEVSDSNRLAYQNVPVDALDMTFSCADLPALECGSYSITIYSKERMPCGVIFFEVIPKEDTFRYTLSQVDYIDRYWTTEPGDPQRIQYVSAACDTIYYEFQLDSIYDYVGFTYKLTDDESGELIDEGTVEAIWYDRCSINCDMSKAPKGNMKLEVFNSNGTPLLTDAIEVM